MKRGLLIIDRGSREKEVKDELEFICNKVKQKGNYFYASYCFLEVVPPFIGEGVGKCLSKKIDTLTIVPYFLYNGRKVKAAVSEAVQYQDRTNTKLIITRPMNMHKTMYEIVDSKIEKALAKNNVSLSKSDIDVLVIGHGSKDPDARNSIKYVVDNLASKYRNISFCFLEIEEPTINQEIKKCSRNNPQLLVVVFYFLHEGAHVKKDIYEDLNPAIIESGIKNVLITEHIGTDSKMIDFIIKRAKEAENAD
jgi:sirohydrochlorin ferrochelatase